MDYPFVVRYRADWQVWKFSSSLGGAHVNTSPHLLLVIRLFLPLQQWHCRKIVSSTASALPSAGSQSSWGCLHSWSNLVAWRPPNFWYCSWSHSSSYSTSCQCQSEARDLDDALKLQATFMIIESWGLLMNPAWIFKSQFLSWDFANSEDKRTWIRKWRESSKMLGDGSARVVL